MENILTYIVKMNIALIILVVIYWLFLRRDTFFTSHRIYLLSAILLSATYQFLPPIVNIDFTPHEEATTLIATYDIPVTISDTAPIKAETSNISIENIAIVVWILICVILFIIKLVVGAIAIITLKLSGARVKLNDMEIISSNKIEIPFSFYRWIFIPTKEFNNERFNDIIAHERAHIKGLHYIDTIISGVVAVLFWYNPAVWALKYFINENLEFIADRSVVKKGHNKKEYQYNLLEFTSSCRLSNIVNYFNITQLKNRIVMMNREKTSAKGLLKYILILPVLMMMTIANSAQDVKTEQKPKNTKNILKVVDPAFLKQNPLLILNGEEISKEVYKKLDPSKIESITVLKDKAAISLYGDKGKEGVLVISTKGAKEGEVVVSNKSNKITYAATNNIVVNVEDVKRVEPKNFVTNVGKDVKQPLFIVDGLEKDKETFDKINKENIKSVTVLKDSVSKAIYGAKGANGVVIIETKNVEKRNIDEQEVKVVKLHTKSSGKVINMKSNNKSIDEIINDLDPTFKSKNPLIMIDGIESSMEMLNCLDPNWFESITILKEITAKAVYGEKGKNGVIIVESKKIEKE